MIDKAITFATKAHEDKRQQAWYYRGLCDSLKDMENFPEYWEFCELIAYVFRGVVVD